MTTAIAPKRRLKWGWLKHPIILLAGLAMVAPFIWMVLTSFKGLPQLLQDPLSFLPDPWVFTNFADAWNALPFARAYFNSIDRCCRRVGFCSGVGPAHAHAAHRLGRGAAGHHLGIFA